jgi:hypothetical protein
MKKIALYLMLFSGFDITTVASDAQSENQSSFWTTERKKICCIVGGVCSAVLGGVLWNFSRKSEELGQSNLGSWILRQILDKTSKTHTPAEFKLWESRLHTVMRTTSVACFATSGYLLHKGLKKNSFMSDLINRVV